MNMEMQLQAHDVPGWGSDKRFERRPGVPRESSPHPLGNAHWGAPPEQQTERSSLVGPNRQVTATYSSAVHARGLSGALRRAAYHVPDHKPRRWMMLLIADRVDVLEHNLPKTLLVLLGVGVAGVGIGAVLRARRQAHG